MMETADGPVDRMDGFEERGADADPERNYAGTASWTERHRDRPRRPDAARAHGFRAAPLPGAAAAQHRRDAGHQRGSRQELPVPRHAEDARRCWEISYELRSGSESVPLYFYGELAPEEEERLEDHVARLRRVPRARWNGFRRIAAALDRREAGAPRRAAGRMPARPDARRLPRRSRPRGAHRAGRVGFLPRPAARRCSPVSRPLAPARWPRMALLALGFFAARLTTGPARWPRRRLPAADVVYSSIRSVQPDASGRVQIAFDETRRRIVTGRMDDDNIRRLLLAAVREEDNPAVRVESVGLLKRPPASSDVRAALLNVALHDPNAAVRLKAIEGLKPFAADTAGARRPRAGAAQRRESGRAHPGHRHAGGAPRRSHGGGAAERGAEGKQRLRPHEVRAGAEGHECVDRDFLRCGGWNSKPLVTAARGGGVRGRSGHGARRRVLGFHPRPARENLPPAARLRIGHPGRCDRRRSAPERRFLGAARAREGPERRRGARASSRPTASNSRAEPGRLVRVPAGAAGRGEGSLRECAAGARGGRGVPPARARVEAFDLAGAWTPPPAAGA